MQARLVALLGLQAAYGAAGVPTLFALRGTIPTPDAIVADGLLVVDHGRI